VVYCTWENRVFGLCASSHVSKSTAFRKLDLFPSSGTMMGARTLLGPLERASLSHWTSERCVFRNVRLWTKSKNTIFRRRIIEAVERKGLKWY
jgi:hypothetical protein